VLRDDDALAAAFESDVLPCLVERARTSGEALPLLVQGDARQLVIARSDALALVCNLLLGTIAPQRSPEPFPRCDASRLLADDRPHVTAKLRCVLEYLWRCAKEIPAGDLVIERCVLSPRDAAAWGADATPLGVLDVVAKGTIEEAVGCLQADFANRFLGGGVLGGGCVQEEIRFSITTELLAAMPLSAAMRDDEAIRIGGVEQFSRYEGYGSGFRFAGGLRDPAPRAANGAPLTRVVAIDAISFGRAPLAHQLAPSTLLREIGKAFVGFAHAAEARVATGNWGCGVFGGHPQLKAMLQWMAASAAGLEVAYYSFGEPRVGDLQGFVDRTRARGVTVGELWRALEAAAPRIAADPDQRDLYRWFA
jgi:poly(ADP-ribose) glycohydrolase